MAGELLQRGQAVTIVTRSEEKARGWREAGAEAALDLGFSPPAARSYAGMTALSLDGGVDIPDDPERGATTLRAYISDLVANSANSNGSA